MPSSSRADEIAAIKAEIQASLNEDPIAMEWALERVDRLAWGLGPGLYSSLLLMLCNVTFEEAEAHRHWEAMLRNRTAMEGTLGRAVGLRVAMLDYLVDLNRRTSRPRLMELLESIRPAGREITDPVTGLHTLSFLEDQLPRETSRARRFNIDLSYVHIEIDEFSEITDRYGSTIGTVLLREMAGIINSCIRTIDCAARTSGAQFALLLTETDRMGAYYLADRIRQRAAEFYMEKHVNGRPFELTASAGVASFPEDADGPEDLAARAREAWHTARARGSGGVAIYYRERREFIRLAVEHRDLQVTLMPEGTGAGSPPSVRNISSGGVLFESEQPIELGRTVQIFCRNRRDADQVVIPGRVVRIERFEGDVGERYEIGVLFDLVVEEQIEGIIEFLERFTAEPSEDQPKAS
ncbi:MAG TPA: diguanylate cyclase [Candidatus Polarisedimenticolia bacterium]|jgi:diguanylate cyclase (GGDEF)-like protein